MDLFPFLELCIASGQGLSRKGLHATAFEIAKLMMSLDDDDAMGIMFCIDYLALRLHDYSWLKVGRLSAQS